MCGAICRDADLLRARIKIYRGHCTGPETQTSCLANRSFMKSQGVFSCKWCLRHNQHAQPSPPESIASNDKHSFKGGLTALRSLNWLAGPTQPSKDTRIKLRLWRESSSGWWLTDVRALRRSGKLDNAICFHCTFKWAHSGPALADLVNWVSLGSSLPMKVRVL